MFEIYFARLAAFVLTTLLALTSRTFQMPLTAAGSAPSHGILLGTTNVVQVGVVILKLTTGTGPTLKTYATFYYTAAGS